MKTLNFSQNWNDKLNQSEFTTIRLHKHPFWTIGDNLTITLGKSSKSAKKLAVGKIISIRTVRINELTETDAQTDIGQSLPYLFQVLSSIYGREVNDWGKQLLVVLKVKVSFRYSEKQTLINYCL